MPLGALFKPFGCFSLAVRYNCPWHRNNFRPCYFPFKMNLKLKKRMLFASHPFFFESRILVHLLETVDARMKTRGGRLILMRRILREHHFLAWNHRGTPAEQRLSYPL
uniref:Secreted protein n=1 Tax=Ascaris lumbricoides TaxID=6252 RepID=A0A0M3HTG5_ASCLU